MKITERRHWRTFFTPCFHVSIVNFENVIAGREVSRQYDIYIQTNFTYKGFHTKSVNQANCPLVFQTRNNYSYKVRTDRRILQISFFK